MPWSPYMTTSKQPRVLPREWTGGGGTPAPTSAGGAGGTSGGYFDASQLEYGPGVFDAPQGLVPIAFGFTDVATGYGLRSAGVTTFTVPFAVSIAAMSVSGSATKTAGTATFSVRSGGTDLGPTLTWGNSLVSYVNFEPGVFDVASGTGFSVYVTASGLAPAGLDAELVVFIAAATTD